MIRIAWKGLHHIFSLQHINTQLPPVSGEPTILHPRLAYNTLAKYPVELLVVNQANNLPTSSSANLDWREIIERGAQCHRPKIVIEMWPSNSQHWSYEPMSKQTNSQWSKLGYNSRYKLVGATEIGGAIQHSRLIVLRLIPRLNQSWDWETFCGDEIPRAMENLLTLPHKVYIPPCLQIFAGTIPVASRDPMPSSINSMIETDKGVRRLRIEEFACGLGADKPLYLLLGKTLLDQTTSLYHWEYVSQCILKSFTTKTSHLHGNKSLIDKPVNSALMQSSFH